MTRLTRWWNFFYQGVWDDPRHSRRVALVKVLSLSVRSFFDSQLWVRAASLTYDTVLAIVPALALVFAICRGLGFQNLLEEQLLDFFPSQSQVVTTGLEFVDRYLTTTTEGVFVGVGVIFLLWTLFSLMSNVEDAFNEAWSVRQGRSLWRKVTDYTAIFFILPILLICSSGINVAMSAAFQRFLPEAVSAVSWLFDALSWVLIWLFFAGSYMLMPNTHVRPRNALIAGVAAGTAFMVLQWLFVSGQVYVSRYNAIYGSFSFLPLLLLWLQLVWLITLAGAAVCYAMQNIYNISYIDKVADISLDYRERVAVAVMAVVVQRFKAGGPAPTLSLIAHEYALPANLVTVVAERLESSGLLRRLEPGRGAAEPGLTPAFSADRYTVGSVVEALRHSGDGAFIPDFGRRFASVDAAMDALDKHLEASDTPLADLDISS